MYVANKKVGCWASGKAFEMHFVQHTHKPYEAENCIYASVNKDIIFSDENLSPLRHQAVIWANAGLSVYCQLGHKEHISMFFFSKFSGFHPRKCRLQLICHLVSASIPQSLGTVQCHTHSSCRSLTLLPIYRDRLPNSKRRVLDP